MEECVHVSPCYHRLHGECRQSIVAATTHSSSSILTNSDGEDDQSSFFTAHHSTNSPPPLSRWCESNIRLRRPSWRGGSGLLIFFITLCLVVSSVWSCNEAICGSIVSKCLLTQSCKCGPDPRSNVTCSRDCFHCLDYLYMECCSCVDVCPKANESHEFSLSHKSNVEDLPEPNSELFKLLTHEQDPLLRWTSVSFPAKHSWSVQRQQQNYTLKMSVVNSSPNETTENGNTLNQGSDHVEEEANCTVAFMSQCMSLNKCRESCRSIGANSYRWFHDGCCECIGEACLTYGINHSQCRKCPLTSLETNEATDFDEEMTIEDPDTHHHQRTTVYHHHHHHGGNVDESSQSENKIDDQDSRHETHVVEAKEVTITTTTTTTSVEPKTSISTSTSPVTIDQSSSSTTMASSSSLVSSSSSTTAAADITTILTTTTSSTTPSPN